MRGNIFCEYKFRNINANNKIMLHIQCRLITKFQGKN